MGQKSKKDIQAQTSSTSNKRINEKREIAIDKLRKLGESDQNVKKIITSLERYCSIILESLEIK